MIVISDSTPLIHFGTIKRLDLLRSMYGRIFITEAVHREVVTEGITLGKMDAILIEKEIGDSDRGCERLSASMGLPKNNLLKFMEFVMKSAKMITNKRIARMPVMWSVIR